MSSYIRTPAGTAAVTSTQVFLPRRVRALLASMEGRFDPHKNTSANWTPQEVLSMLDTLQLAGYVQPAPEGGGVPPAASTTPSRSPMRPLPPAGPARAFTPGNELPDALALMNDFVMAYLPDEALQILFALEGLSSTSQLRAGLGAYEARVAQLGPAGRRHLAELHALLGRDASLTTTN